MSLLGAWVQRKHQPSHFAVAETSDAIETRCGRSIDKKVGSKDELRMTEMGDNCKQCRK